MIIESLSCFEIESKPEQFLFLECLQELHTEEYTS